MRSLITVAGILATAFCCPWALAGDCCQHCGCNSGIRKVCRLTCEVKKVPETTYSCECEDFCVPGRSLKCGSVCETDCNGCEHCKPNWVPQCASVYTRSTLKKTTVDKEKKVYKWVVEYVCDNCSGKCAGVKMVSDEPLAESEASRRSEIVPVSSNGQSRWLLKSLFNK
jgi:hypothetical protein